MISPAAIKLKLYTFPINSLIYRLWKKPCVLEIFDTIHQLQNGKSIARYGDGEFDIIYGRQEGFQTPNSKLAKRLLEILNSDVPNLLVGIPDIFEDRIQFTARAANHWKWYKKYHARELIHILKKSNYANSLITRSASDFENFDQQKLFNELKKIWNKRDVLIVEGEKTRIGVGNDLLANATSIQRILCPAENAFDRYQEILETVCKYASGDKLIIMALGPTATLLAHDLTLQGFQALDLGHFDIQYEYYIRNSSDKVLIPGKYNNEVEGGSEVAEIIDEAYEKSIICKI